jgi:tetratricopeptide (TPR) repeat protein
MRRYVLLTLTILISTGTAWTQNIQLGDRPKVLQPKKPPTRQAMEQRDALHQYVEGLRLAREGRQLDALKAFEESARLDPAEVAPIKAQLPILLSLNRLSDGLNACKQIVAIDPGDYGVWYTQSKLLKALAKYPEAIASLETGLKCDRLKAHPEAGQQMYFELGSLCESVERFGPAADAFNKAAEILEHPDQIMAKGDNIPRNAILARASETYERIGQLYRKAKRYDDALAALTKAQQHAPTQAARVSFIMAQISLERGSLQDALTHVDAYLRSRPLSTDAYVMKIDLLRRLKQADRIVPWLEEAARQEKHNSALQLVLAQEFVHAKQTKKAEALYKKLAEDSPSADLYRGLFRLYKDEGPAGMTRVLGMLDKVIDKATSDEVPASQGTVQHARAMVGALREDGELAQQLVVAAFKQRAEKELNFDTVYFLAMLADRHRKNEEAERFYRACLRDKNVGPKNEAVIYGGLLRVLGKARKHDAVIQVCLEGLKGAKATNPLLFYSDIARAYAGLHRYDEALKYAGMGDTQAGDNNKLVFKTLRIRILTMAERFTDAETECKTLIKAEEKPGTIVDLRYLLSNIYSAAKKQDKSEEQLQLILKIDPHNATVNNDLGYLWADQGRQLEEAEGMIRKALELDRIQRRRNPSLTAEDDKDNAAYVDSLGWVLFRRGKIEEARTELERATILGDGDDPVIYDHLGDVYVRLKLMPEASRAFQKALELYENGARGKDEERTRDLQRKLKQTQAEIGGR